MILPPSSFLGHNLQSDENYLNELFQHLTNLKTVMDFKKENVERLILHCTSCRYAQ